MADEFTIDAKYKRDNLVAEHERYRRRVEELEAELAAMRGAPRDDQIAETVRLDPDRVRDVLDARDDQNDDDEEWRWTVRLADEVEIRNAVIEGPLNPLLDGGCEVVRASRFEEVQAELLEAEARNGERIVDADQAVVRAERAEAELERAREALEAVEATRFTSNLTDLDAMWAKVRAALSRAEETE